MLESVGQEEEVGDEVGGFIPAHRVIVGLRIDVLLGSVDPRLFIDVDPRTAAVEVDIDLVDLQQISLGWRVARTFEYRTSMAGANSLNRMTSKFVMYPSDDTVLVSTYASAMNSPGVLTLIPALFSFSFNTSAKKSNTSFKALGEDLTMELYTSNSED